MQRIGITALLLAMAGCGGEISDNNHGYGWDSNATTESGIRIKYQDGAQRLPADDIEQAYRDTAACMGFTVLPGPFVVLTPDTLRPDDPLPVQGLMYHDNGTVVVMSSDTIDPASTLYVLRHEYVHYHLLRTGFPHDRNMAHDSPYVSLCG